MWTKYQYHPCAEVCQRWPIPYWVKQCLYISNVMYSIPRWGNLQDPRQGQGQDGKFFVFLFFLVL